MESVQILRVMWASRPVCGHKRGCCARKLQELRTFALTLLTSAWQCKTRLDGNGRRGWSSRLWASPKAWKKYENAVPSRSTTGGCGAFPLPASYLDTMSTVNTTTTTTAINALLTWTHLISSLFFLPLPCPLALHIHFSARRWQSDTSS